MFCPQCGNNIKEEAKFCSNCGWAIPVTAVQAVVMPIGKQCSSCGTALKDEAQFCPNCGQAVLAQVIMEQKTKPAEEEDKYLLSYDLKESGPYTIDQIIEGIKKGTFTENYYICKANSSEWKKITEIKTLESSFKKRTAFRVTAGLVLLAVGILIIISVIFSLMEPVTQQPQANNNQPRTNSSNTQQGTTSSSSNAQNVIDININTLLREINNNEARAQQLYGGKIIRTRGIVQEINIESVWIGFEVDIWSDDDYDDYLGVLYVCPSDTSELINLRKGQTITVRGLISASGSPRFIYYAVIE